MPDNKQPALTREEQIKSVALKIFPTNSISNAVNIRRGEDQTTFKLGAQWADATPSPVSSSGEDLNALSSQNLKESFDDAVDQVYGHTPGPWFPINYAGFWIIQSGKYYGDKDVLDAEKVGVEISEANARLAASAPELKVRLHRLQAELTRLRQPPAEGMRDALLEVERLILAPSFVGCDKKMLSIIREAIKPSAPTTSDDKKGKE